MPSGSGGGGGGYGALGGAYANAQNEARGANESRYNDILGGFNQLLGGGGGSQQRSGGSMMKAGSTGPVAQWKASGSPMSFSEWRAMAKKLEQTAARRGGAYGSVDASQVYPREWGQGGFLGDPNAPPTTGVGAYGQRPTMPPPVYPTYTPPQRGPQNY